MVVMVQVGEHQVLEEVHQVLVVGELQGQEAEGHLGQEEEGHQVEEYLEEEYQVVGLQVEALQD